MPGSAGTAVPHSSERISDDDGGQEASPELEEGATPDASGDAAEAISTSLSEEHERPLFRRFPRLAEVLPWIDLGGLPTPLVRAERLGERIGTQGLIVKCDDQAGAEYGGSKARKLEHLLAEAISRDSSGVLTIGGVGSNHALATAIHARRQELDCTLLLLPESPSEHARAHLLAEHRLGCEQLPARGVDASDIDGALARRGREERPYVIPMGGTSPLGNAGYVNAAFELATQCEEGSLDSPDVIYVALGTTGTAAGLYVGLRAAGLPSRLVAVRASNPGTGSLRHLHAEIEATSTFLHGLDPSFPEIEPSAELLRLEHGFAGRGYAIPSEAGGQATEIAREAGGIELDSTYTAKAFAALIHDASAYVDQSVLFWNTYDPRVVSTEGVTPQDLPRSFRRYLP